MPENVLTDARLRTARRDKDGAYLSDGGGLRFRLLPPSRSYPKGAKLAEYHFSLKQPDGKYKSTAISLGTVGAKFADASGTVRAFGLSDARTARDAARAQVSQGIDPRSARRLAKLELVEEQRSRLVELEERRTVAQAFARWHELYVAKHRKDGGVFVEELFKRHVLPAIGALPLQSLRRAQITNLLDALTAQGVMRTANMTLSLLRQFLRWCAVRDWIDRDPTLGLSKSAIGGKEKPRDRTLSIAEIAELAKKIATAELPERITAALWLILATGVRVGELSSAKVTDFDLEANTWLIPDTKNAQPHLVHLSDFAKRHACWLIELRGEGSYVLPSRGEDRPIHSSLIAKMVGDRQRATPLKGRTKASGALSLEHGKWTPRSGPAKLNSAISGNSGQ